MAESKEELKNLLMRVKGESEKAGLKLSIQRTKIMTSSTITSWQTDGEKLETVAYLIFWAQKSLWRVTAATKLKDSPWKKSYHKPRRHIKEQRHHFANKGRFSQSSGFSNSHI